MEIKKWIKKWKEKKPKNIPVPVRKKTQYLISAMQIAKSPTSSCFLRSFQTLTTGTFPTPIKTWSEGCQIKTGNRHEISLKTRNIDNTITVMKIVELLKEMLHVCPQVLTARW